MGERTSYTPGTLCWVDLVVEDPNAAKEFYAGLFGWEYDEQPSYSVAQLTGRAVAAIAPLPEPSMTPHWNCYVSVEDADAAVARAEALGATVVLAAGDAGESGRLAAFQDPQGAILSVWQPGRHFGAAVVNGPGALSWNDLLTPDVEASAAFYRELFGWDVPGGAYGQVRAGIGGGIGAGGEHRWATVYASVPDVEACLARAEALGGTRVYGPKPVDDHTGTGAFRDPAGNLFGVYHHAPH